MQKSPTASRMQSSCWVNYYRPVSMKRLQISTGRCDTIGPGFGVGVGLRLVCGPSIGTECGCAKSKPSEMSSMGAGAHLSRWAR